MKLEDLVYQVAGEALSLLEQKFHYHVTEDHKREIQAAVRDDLSSILKRIRPQK